MAAISSETLRKTPATNLFGRQVAKDTFYQIEPRTAGRDEMHLDARVACQPPLDHGVLVRGVVVGDQMQGLALGDLAIKQTQERQPFLVPMPRQAGGEDGALRDIEGGEERGGPMALVVVCHRAHRPFFMGKPGWVRSSAWIWLFSSTLRTTACKHYEGPSIMRVRHDY